MGKAFSRISVLPEDAPTGSIQWEFDKDSISTDHLYSPTIEVGGIQWALSARKMLRDESQLGSFLNQMEGDYEVKWVDVSFEIKLLNHDDNSKSISNKLDEPFVNIDSWGLNDIIKWEDAIDERKGFIKDGKLTLQCDFSLFKIRGFRELRRIDFTNQDEPSHDVVLVVDGEKFFVSKQYFSILSPVFHKMFYGNPFNKEKKEIVLNDVIKKEFHEMLSVIYPPHKKISDESVTFLLKLGHQFEIDMVLKEVERFLIASKTMTISAKLLFADQYILENLQDYCLDQLKEVKDLKDMKNSTQYRHFSDSTRALLFEKMMALAE